MLAEQSTSKSPHQQIGECEHARLVFAYSEAVDAYSRVLQHLAHVRIVGTQAEHEAALEATAGGRKFMREALAALEYFRHAQREP